MMREVFVLPFELWLPGFGFLGAEGVLMVKAGALIFSILVTLFLFAEWIIFPLYLRAVGQSVRARRGMSNCIGIVIFAGIAGFVTLIGQILWYIYFKNPPTTPGVPAMLVVSLIVSLIAHLALVGLMIWYCLTVFSIRAQVD